MLFLLLVGLKQFQIVFLMINCNFFQTLMVKDLKHNNENYLRHKDKTIV